MSAWQMYLLNVLPVIKIMLYSVTALSLIPVVLTAPMKLNEVQRKGWWILLVIGLATVFINTFIPNEELLKAMFTEG